MTSLKFRPKSAQNTKYVSEFVRTDGEFLFDEVAISKIEFTQTGILFSIEYERQRKRITVSRKIPYSARDFALAREASMTDGKLDREKFAQTRVVALLFSEGAKEWAGLNKPVEADFSADLQFLTDLANQQ